MDASSRGFTLAAQPASQQFEAASVKPVAYAGRPNFPGNLRGGPGTNSPGRVSYSNVPLRRVLAVAFGVHPSRIAGPAWLDEARFEITAALPPNATGVQLKTMLQKLLADRFQLTWHREAKKLPAYVLSVAGGRPELAAASGTGASGCVFKHPDSAAHAVTSRDSTNHSVCSNMSMSDLAEALPGLAPLYIDLAVVDQTGLTGRYDFALDWTTFQENDDPGGPTLFEALDRQLGLKLEPRDAPLDAIVIDRINRTPSAN